MPNYIDETGNRYGKLSVIKKSRKKTRKAFWDCKCDCGNEYTVRADRLRAGITTSCGCDVYQKTLTKKGLEEGEAQFNALYSSYIVNSKRKELDFDLTKEEFRHLTSLGCYYCGKPPSEIMKKARLKGSYMYSGIDRKQNDIGYNLQNCVPCCTDCNYMKSNVSYKDFINKLEKVYLNLKSRGVI